MPILSFSIFRAAVLLSAVDNSLIYIYNIIIRIKSQEENEKNMTEMTEAVTNIAGSIIETTVSAENTDSIGVMISSAINSSDSEKDKIERVLSVIGNKCLDLLPALGWALTAFIIGLLLSKLTVHLFRKVLNKSKVDSAAVSFLGSLLKAFMYVIVIIIALSILNVPMTSLIAVLSAAGLAVGLALQGSLSNLAGGFIILISKPFKAGDYIETNSCSGYVESISILYTKILTLDNKTVYIPNGSVTGATITNFSEKPERRVDLEFGISYSDDFERARKTIIKTAEKNPLILRSPIPPFARMASHGESAVMIKTEVWTKTENYWQVKYDMNEQVYAAFREKGIDIPFRQVDVHMIPDNTDKNKNTAKTDKNGDDKKNGKQQQ